MERPNMEIDKKVLRRRFALLAAISSIFLMIFTLPAWQGQAFAMAVAIVALVLSIRFSTAAMVISIIMIAVAFLTTIGTLLLSTEINRYAECQLGANTHVATNTCTEGFRADLEARLSAMRTVK